MARWRQRANPAFFDSGFSGRLKKRAREKFNLRSVPAGDPENKNPADPDFSDWSVEVPGQGRARPPVAINFSGTVIQEKTDPFASAAQKEQRAQKNQKRIEKNKAVLDRAIFILSQSATGRSLLEDMTKEGYKIVFDDRRTGERGASGLCDSSSKTILLHGHDNPEYLALLLGHEAVHALQSSRHDLFPSSRHKPEAGIKISFAIEADAYAQQTQIALELGYGDPAGPADQVRFSGPVLQMRERFPDLVKAAKKTMQTEDALQNGATVAAAFQAFYDNFYLRTFYEDSHMDWATLYAPKIKSGFPWLQKNFTKDVDSNWLKARIQHKGIAYLERHAPHLDFSDARHAGVTAETGLKLKAFYQEHLPKEPPPAPKLFGVYMKDATSWVLGLSSTIHMVISGGKPPDKPPLRPPPQRRWGFWD